MLAQVLANGEEVRLQRNALQIVALPVHGDTDFSDMDDEDTTVFPAGGPTTTSAIVHSQRLGLSPSAIWGMPYSLRHGDHSGSMWVSELTGTAVCLDRLTGHMTV